MWDLSPLTISKNSNLSGEVRFYLHLWGWIEYIMVHINCIYTTPICYVLSSFRSSNFPPNDIIVRTTQAPCLFCPCLVILHQNWGRQSVSWGSQNFLWIRGNLSAWNGQVMEAVKVVRTLATRVACPSWKKISHPEKKMQVISYTRPGGFCSPFPKINISLIFHLPPSVTASPACLTEAH